MIKIFGLKFYNLSLNDSVDRVLMDSKHKKTTVALTNPEFIVESKQNANLYEYLKDVNFQFCDGIGIKIASYILCAKSIKFRVTGTDFLPCLIKKSKSYNYKFYFFGGKPGVAFKAKKILEKITNNNCVVGFCDGYNYNSKDLINEINSLNVDVLMVCLGNPRQEEWIQENLEFLNVKIIFGNGGALDFFSGNIRRAPRFIQIIGFEWLFRLFQDPSFNRFSRQFKLITKFPIIILKEYFKVS